MYVYVWTMCCRVPLACTIYASMLGALRGYLSSPSQSIKFHSICLSP